jgi:hypothetical protein
MTRCSTPMPGHALIAIAVRPNRMPELLTDGSRPIPADHERPLCRNPPCALYEYRKSAVSMINAAYKIFSRIDRLKWRPVAKLPGIRDHPCRCGARKKKDTRGGDKAVPTLSCLNYATQGVANAVIDAKHAGLSLDRRAPWGAAASD